MSRTEGDGEITRLQRRWADSEDRGSADVLTYQKHHHGPNIPKRKVHCTGFRLK